MTLQKKTYNSIQPSKNQEQLISATISEDNNLLTFEADFNKTKIKVYANENLIFNDIISTDGSLGVARGILFDKETKKLKLKINDEFITVKNLKKYRFIYISNSQNRYQIEYSKVPKIYY